MLLNISGRTDIVAFYSTWLFKRLEAGYVDVRNPFYPKLVNRIYFKDVDAFVFCTKNPLPILNRLKHDPNCIKKPMYFFITLTPYKKDIEPNVIDKKLIIAGIKELAKIIGKENLAIRYDPIFLNDYYNLDYHLRAFSKLCSELKGCTEKIIVSFIDDYQNTRRHQDILKIKEFTLEDYQKIGLTFSRIAKENNMAVQTCCEEHNLVEYGFLKEDCLSLNLAYRLTGKTNFKKWRARGKNCNCAMMVDIGYYNSCGHLCRYCYANYQEEQIKKNIACHDPNSSLLIGHLNKDDIIKERRA